MEREIQVVQDVKVSIRDYMDYFGVNYLSAIKMRGIDRYLIKNIFRDDCFEINLSHFVKLYSDVPVLLSKCVTYHTASNLVNG